jgi:hypothetical protein
MHHHAKTREGAGMDPAFSFAKTHFIHSLCLLHATKNYLIVHCHAMLTERAQINENNFNLGI